MKLNRTLVRAAGLVAAVAALTLGAAGAAQAGGVFWSVGVNSPGVAVGVANAPPVYVAPQPVYVAPQPVYVQPSPVYVQPRPVYVQPRPMYVQPAPVYYGAPPRYVQAEPVYRAGWVPPGHRRWHKHRDRDDWDD